MMNILGSFLAGYIGKRALDATLESFQRDVLRPRRLKFSPQNSKSVDEALNRLLIEAQNWSGYMEYGPGPINISFKSIYIELDCFLEPIARADERSNKKRKMKDVLRTLDGPLILLGRPGYGKTTTVKAICADLLNGRSQLKNCFPVPVVIRLREVDNTVPLVDILLDILNIEFVAQGKGKAHANPKDDSTNKDVPIKLSDTGHLIKLSLISQIMNDHAMVLIIDGFDEITHAQIEMNRKMVSCKDKFLYEFRELCRSINNAHIILTSRTADFPYEFEAARKYEISPLSVFQIKRFVDKFMTDPAKAAAAKEQIIEKKILGAEFIPLTLTYICMIFKRYGKMFNSRRELYGRILDLVLDEWDISRGVRRISAFADFDTYDKRRFLKQLSYELSSGTREIEHITGSYFTTEQMKSTFKSICQDYDGLSERDFRTVFREIETHTGILLQSGLGYIFSHKTIQEYLFAMYLIEYPELPRDEKFIAHFPNELAIAVSFNENPSMYFAYLMMQRQSIIGDHEREFLLPFLDRLILEDTKFRVHPYLAIGFLTIFTKLVYRRDRFEGYLDSTKNFYKFLSTDAKLVKSFSQLSQFYSISGHSEKGYVILKKTGRVDPIYQFSEPEELCAPYELYELFLEFTSASKI